MATKPSPYTFINDTDGLGNTANVISVQQNANNTNTLIATYLQNNLDNNPQLQILNSAGGANGQIQFNNSRGFGGSSNLTYTESTSRLQLRGNLYVTGNLFANIQTNLNNFHLTGGANGQVLTTDGTGNVTWIDPDPNVSGSLYNGNSNVIVHANGNITFSSNGVANVAVISNQGLYLAGPSNLKISGGNATNYLTTDGNGNLYWTDDVPIYIGNSAPNLPVGHLWFDSDEGRAYINYDGNSWVDLSPAVLPNPDIFANTITFPDGSVQTTAGGGGGNPFNQNLNTTNNVTFSSVTATAGNLAQINGVNAGGTLIIQTGGSKNWNFSNTGILTLPFDNYLETTDIDLKAGSQGNVFIRANAAGGANIQTWNFDKTGNITFPDNTKQRTAFTGFIAGANVTGVVANSTRAATVTTNAQPNITSVGTLTSLSATGNVSANFFIGNGSQLTGITSASATTVTANAQPNITSVGNLNSLSVTGNIRTANLIVTGNTDSISPTSGSIHTAGGIGAQGNIVGNNHLYIGPGSSLTAFVNPVFIGKQVGADYIQSAMVNSSDTGSSDWVAYGDNGTESGGWSDFGFTGSAFNDANYTVTAPNDGYFFVQAQAGSYGGNLVLATGNQGTTNDIIFATGGFQTGNIFGRINHTTQTFETSSGKISAGGNITGGNLFTGNNVSATGNITGANIFTGGVVSANGNVSGQYLLATNAAGDEGGEIHLAKPPNGILGGGVTVDAYLNRIRFFEDGGSVRGAYIDLSQAASSVGTLLNNRVTTGYNLNTPEVTLGNFKAGINGSSQPYIKSASGTFVCYWTTMMLQFDGVSSFPVTTGGGQGVTITTSGQTLGYTLAYGSDTLTGTFNDTSSGVIYRVTWSGSPTGTTYGTVTIERLV